MVEMNEVELAKELLKLDSQNPPGNEKEIALFIKDFLEDLKIQVELMEFGRNRFNVIASIGKGDGLMLSGHIDTVPIGKVEDWKFNPFGEVKGGRIYGRGAVDMKGGLASMLVTVKNLVERKVEFKRRLLLAFVGDEETSLGGSKFLIKRGRDLLRGIRYGVIAEPTNLEIVRAQKGIASMKVKIAGKAAHGSKPELGDNAIYKACELIQEIRKLIKKLGKREDELLGAGTINVGKIAGGTKVNVVPNYCEVEIDRRIIPGETPKLAKGQIEEIVRKLKIRAKVEVSISRLPMKIPENLEFIRLLKQLTGKKTRGESGYTEAELYYRECGIPCVVCGPGNMDLAHKVNEYIEISELKMGSVVFEKLIRKLCC